MSVAIKKRKTTVDESVLELEHQVQTWQKWRDESERRLASESMMHFLVHLNEFTNTHGKLSQDALQWAKANQKTVDDLMQSISAFIVTSCAPQAKKDNRAEVENELGTELALLLDMINKKNDREVDAYTRKAFIYFAMAMSPSIRTFVKEKSEKAGEVERGRVDRTIEFIIEHTKVFLHAGAVTWAPVHSGIIAYVQKIDFFYNNMSLQLTTYFES